MATLNYTTPQEYIDFYFNDLKNNLQIYDLQANKFGFMGYTLNMLGFTNFDLKTYYDSLFKEGFVATSQEDKNLFVHASTYGYNPGFCQAANAVGNFIFDFADLPSKPDTVSRREVYFGTTSSLVQFTVDSYTFTSESQYKFIEETITNTDGTTTTIYYAIIYTSDGKIINVPSASSKITVPMYNVYQYAVQSFEVTLDSYPMGQFFSTQFTIDQPFLYSLTVSVHKPSDTAGVKTQYEIKRVKYFEKPFSQTIFFRQVSDTVFELEYGSGIKGDWLSEATIYVDVTVTSGDKANLNRNTQTITKNVNDTTYQVGTTNYIYYIDITNNVSSAATYLPPQYITVDFEYSENGTTPNTGDLLRNEVVNFIQTRENFINQKDFYNITQNYINDFKFIFKKANILDNTFYLCRTFRDKYQIPIYSTNKSVELTTLSLIPSIDTISTVNTTSGILTSGIYNYHICGGNRFFMSLPSIGSSATIDSSTNAIKISFTQPTHKSEVYRIYRTNPDGTKCYFEVYPDTVNTLKTVIDDGNFTYTSIDTIPTTEFTYSEVFQPRFNICHNNTVQLGSYTWKLTNSNIYYMTTSSTTFPDPGILKPTVISNLIENTSSSSLAPGQWCFGDYNSLGFNTIYVRLSDNTSPSTKSIDYLTANLVNQKEFISPFLYKYNTLMGWYDGYLLYKFLLINFKEFTYNTTTTTTNGATVYPNIPPLYLNLSYDFENKQTIIYLKSYQKISTYNFKLSIIEKSLSNISMTSVDDNTFKYVYTSDTGRFDDPFSISINAYDLTNAALFTCKTDNIYQVVDITDQLRLLMFTLGTSKYILSIPCMNSSVYDSDFQYYTQKMYDFLVGFTFKENRMQTDNVQFRFNNCYCFERDFLSKCTLQQYQDFDLIFPLKMSINVRVYKQYVINNNINLQDIKLAILDLVSNYLSSSSTGYNFKYYNSQIEDIIHGLGTYILSVKVSVTDSSLYPNTISNGLEILEERQFMDKLRDDKVSFLNYTPHMFYWDVDNITLNIEL